MHLNTCYAVFEETQIIPGSDQSITFRAEIAFTDIENWNIVCVEVPTGDTVMDHGRRYERVWVEVTYAGGSREQAVRSICWDIATSTEGYRVIEDAITAAMAEQRERAQFDDADRAHAERIEARAA